MSSPLPLGTVDPNPPLPLSLFPAQNGTLTGGVQGDAPLTDAERTTIYTYIAGRSGRTLANVEAEVSALAGVNGRGVDATLETLYTGFVNGQTNVNTGGAIGSDLPTVSVPSIPNPISSVEDFLSLLANPNTWIRTAEFAVGFLMLGIAAYAIVKNSTGGPSQRTTSVSHVVKKVVPASRAVL